MTLTIHAPTDAQLAYISDLCRKNGVAKPDAIASSDEASRIITELRTGNYVAEKYAYWRGWEETVPF